MKRKREIVRVSHLDRTPTRKWARNAVHEADGVEEASDTIITHDETPSKASRNTGKRSADTHATPSILEASKTTPKARANATNKILYATPTKPRFTKSVSSVAADADRSARRKSARNLIERTVTGNLSDDSELEAEESLAKQIWEDGEEDVDEDDEDTGSEKAEEAINPGIQLGEELPDDEAALTATPSKRRPGRPKGARQKRTPTPPADLPAHEQYFFQNRPGKIKASSNTLSSISLLSHSDYHSRISSYTDPHTSSISFLHALHTRAFPQWIFELSQCFSLCLYGYGSKRALVTSFANHIHSVHPESSPPTTIIVNGYHPTCTPAQILTTIIETLTPPLPGPLPMQPPALLSHLLNHLATHPPSRPIYLLINSIDAPKLRKPVVQSLLASLAAQTSIYLLASADQPSFPLLWDVSLLAKFNFLFHDATTFVPYDDGQGTGEVGGVVDAVHELMGRKGIGRRGREGVGWVLQSLPENARGVFRILVGELLALDAHDSYDAHVDEDDSASDDVEAIDGFEPTDVGPRGIRRKTRGGADEVLGVEYKMLYQKAVEEFLCSSEMAFRTLLKEFHDHQIIISRRDGSGAEVLGVPMRREELEGVLEDLV
ncbi:Origin recognition complex subunit 2 [Ptychographa xylographoides]|nr:Origin recognition complex subunit 2 [Ptychographa xylographoides]